MPFVYIICGNRSIVFLSTNSLYANPTSQQRVRYNRVPYNRSISRRVFMDRLPGPAHKSTLYLKVRYNRTS